MDPERQPLLGTTTSEFQSKLRPLTRGEVLASRHEIPWRRFRIILVLVFWGTIALCISVIACLLIAAPKCPSSVDLGPVPSVPSSHLTLAPLISKGRLLNDVQVL